MLDVKAEEQQAFTKKNELSAYLLELKAERDQLLSIDVLIDPIATAVRLAKIDAQLLAGKEVFQKVTALHEDLQRRQADFKGPRNYMFSVAKRG